MCSSDLHSDTKPYSVIYKTAPTIYPIPIHHYCPIGTSIITTPRYTIQTKPYVVYHCIQSLVTQSGTTPTELRLPCCIVPTSIYTIQRSPIFTTLLLSGNVPNHFLLALVASVLLLKPPPRTTPSPVRNPV